MRRLGRAIVRLTEGLLGLAVLWLPVVLMGAMAYDYLQSFVQTVLAPGVPIVVAYEAQGGEYRFRVESLRIDLARQSGVIQGGSLRGPDGKVLARAARVAASYRNGVVLAEVDRPWLLVERLPGGEFNFQKALPKPTEEPSTAVFSAVVRRAAVSYVDRTQTPVLSDEIEAPLLKIDGSMGKVSIRGFADAASTGTVAARATVDPDQGWFVGAEMADVPLPRAMAQAERWLEDRPKEWPELVSGGTATGRLEVGATPAGKFSWRGTADFRATGVRVSDWADRAGVVGRATVDTRLAVIEAETLEGGRRANVKAAIAFQGNLRVQGRVTALAGSKDQLWPMVRGAVPKDASFSQANVEGWFAYGPSGATFVGSALAARASYALETVQRPSVALSLAGDQLRVRSKQAFWTGRQVMAGLIVNLDQKTLSGWGTADRGPVRAVLARAGLKTVGGEANLEAMISGTLDRPVIFLSSRGAAILLEKGGRERYLGLFDLRGAFVGGRLQTQRAAISGPMGTVSVSGSTDLDDQSLAIRLDGASVALSSLNSEWLGTVLADGTIGGTWDRPVARLSVEGYGVGVEGTRVPISSAQIVADHRGARLVRARLQSGVTSAEANGTYAWNGGINGSFQVSKAQIADWIELEDEIAGWVDVSNGRVSGTLKDPLVTAQVSATEILALDTYVPTADAHVTYQSGVLTWQNGAARFLEGNAQFAGRFVPRIKSGTATFILTDLNLEKTPEQLVPVRLNGSVSGQGNLRVVKNQLAGLTTSLHVQNLGINDTLVGTGTVQGSYGSAGWSGAAEFGYADRFLVVESARYDPKNNTVGGRLDVYNLPLGDLATAVHEAAPDAGATLTRLSESLEGVVTASVQIDGELEDPTVLVKDLKAEKLVIAGKDAGTITTSAKRESGVWTLGNTVWQAGATRAVLKGKISEEGAYDAVLDVSNLDGSWLKIVDPNAPNIRARADLALVGVGTVQNPALRGTARLEVIQEQATVLNPNNQPASVDFDTIELKDGLAVVEGQFFAESFTGRITGRSSLDVLRGEPKDNNDRFDLRINVRERDVDDFKEVLPALDATRSSGKIAAALRAMGTLEDVDLSGILTLREGSLALDGYQSGIKNAGLVALFRQGRIVVQGSGESLAGGTAKIEATIDLEEAFTDVSSLKQVLDRSPIRGEIRMDKLAVNEPSVGEGGAVAATIERAKLILGGTLLQPSVGGEIALGPLDLKVPTLGEATAASAPPVNPIFRDIKIATTAPVRVRASTATLDLTGEALIAGTLVAPKATSQLIVQDGVFNLPAARVQLEEGGTLAFRYDGTGPGLPVSRLDVVLDGRTVVTAQKGDTVDRYDVDLRITGNLLEENGMVLSATSDPPELSQSEILAILGQRDFIEALAQQAVGRPSQQSQLRDAVLTLAVPTLSGALTSGLASGLKLDYISIDYNAFEQTSFTAGKTLAKGFSLMVRQQLAATRNLPRKWEFRLSYRVPSKNTVLSKVRLGLGMTNEVPWRFTLDYTFRF